MRLVHPLLQETRQVVGPGTAGQALGRRHGQTPRSPRWEFFLDPLTIDLCQMRPQRGGLLVWGFQVSRDYAMTSGA